MKPIIVHFAESGFRAHPGEPFPPWRESESRKRRERRAGRKCPPAVVRHGSDARRAFDGNRRGKLRGDEFRQSPEGNDVASYSVDDAGAAVEDDAQHQFGDVIHGHVVAAVPHPRRRARSPSLRRQGGGSDLDRSRYAGRRCRR